MKRLLYMLITLMTCIQTFGQSITVTSPNDGSEVWNTGTNRNITWTSQSVSQVKIDYSTDGGASWFPVVANTASSGSYNWTVNTVATSLHALIKISDAGNPAVYDVSDNDFKIGPVADAHAGADVTICAGSSTQLQVTSAYYDGTVGPPPPPPAATYLWSPSYGLSDPNIANPVASPGQTVMYFVRVDYNGVIAEDTVIVFVDSIALNPVLTHVSCNGGSDASICTNADGISPFTYTWSNGANTPCITNLTAGVYTVSVQNSLGCTSVGTYTIYQPTALNIGTTHTNATCMGASNGSVCTNVTGGTPPYAYLWSPNITTACSNALPIGTYSITVTDAAGCTASASESVLADSITLTATLITGCENTVCIGESGGTWPITYAWSNGEVTSCAVYQPGLPYGVTVSDGAGCTATASGVAQQASALSVTLNTTDVLCNGAATGSLTVNVTGALSMQYYILEQPYIQQTTPVFNNLEAGTYIIRTIDTFWCEHRDTFSISQPTALVIDTMVVTNSSCFGAANGSVCATVSGGTGTLTYLWVPGGTTTPCATNLAAGIYMLTVTDANNCQTADTVQITEPSLLSISATTTNITCNGQANGSIDVTATGGCGNYTYAWSNSVNGSNNANLHAANYIITVVDACNCSLTASFTITEPATPLTVQIVNPGDGIYPDTLAVNVTGGIPPYQYTWSTGSSAITQDVFVDGVYDLTVMDSNGCIAGDTALLGCVNTCVWPGDANYDGIADNTDLLAIGLGNGTNGPARVAQDNAWTAHTAYDWVDTLITGSNYKHIDCDGNGTINPDDTLAIVQNYALTHPRSGGWDEWRGGAPALRIGLSPDTLIDGETMVVTLSLGDGNTPANNIYGLAFTFNYDALVVDSSEVNMAFGNSWLCGTGDHIDLHKKFYSNGTIEAAVTRIDHTTRSGGGPIATITMKITTGNINGKNLDYYGLLCSVSNVVMIDNAGNMLPVNATADSSVVAYEPTTGIQRVETTHLQLYPNPATSQLYVNGNTAMQSLQVINLLGETVITQNGINAKNTILDIATLDGGTYLLKVKTATGEYFKRFVKVK